MYGRNGDDGVKVYELNRKTYDKVKKMDHGQMKSFCENLYMRGFEEGRREYEGLSNEEIRKILLQVNGIGEKKAHDVAVALELAKRERKALANGQKQSISGGTKVYG